VTGGAGKLGLAAARGLLEHGLSGLSIFDLRSTLESEASKTSIEALVKEFPQAKIVTHDVNVTDENSIEEAVNATVKELGGIDVLLAFAGVVGCVNAEEITPKEWKRVMDINTTGTWLCAHAVGK
jgi:sorbose reductase